MKTKIIQLIVVFAIIVSSCSKRIEYTQDFKDQTSGKYLYNQDDVIEVFYQSNKLFLKWRGAAKIEPVVLEENEIFMVDMYKKLRFVQHPETNERYLSIIQEDNEDVITYDYLKVAKDYKTPSMYLKEKNYDKALAGFLLIKKKDSTSDFINEREFNSLGYKHIRDKKYKDALEIFKINVVLHPTSDNVYDSLAEGYLLNNDSLQAYTNFTKALDLNNRNRRAKAFVDAYSIE
ncbi:tetratricopeptide repeat protein [uncultured Winogradskyella sp.]|uniref:tetratricopeptide repeat protein n=1 Tax=uncultured Winogradskyella sp. TaxID=395353 RepID=UPI0030DD3B2E|tara:strand:+ start:6014 stop:6712 length:699 start_codon:yes stop_codon:yes gene_type:complete